MTGSRSALIVATDRSPDPGPAHTSSTADVSALAEVLGDPDIGGYSVQSLVNRPHQEIELSIARFFARAARHDQLLLYLSCQVVQAPSGEHYLTTIDSRLDLLAVTGVSVSFVAGAMSESRADLVLVFLDCSEHRPWSSEVPQHAGGSWFDRLTGPDRTVIAASNPLRLGMETGDGGGSDFLRALVGGLRSGDADLDLDGLVSLDELYGYLRDRYTGTDPSHVLRLSSGAVGEVYVARRGTPVSTPAPLPQQLSDVLLSGEVWERRGAVARLQELLSAGHPGRALAARLALERLVDQDTSLRVRNEARSALSTTVAPPDRAPDVPAYTSTEAVGEADAPAPGSDTELPPPPPRAVGASTQAAITSAVSAYVSEGRLLFDPPQLMRLGRTERVAVALSQRPGLDAQLRSLAGASASAPTQPVETSPFMEVELKGSAFDITPLQVAGASEQMLRPLALWQYDVTPRRSGAHDLHLCVAMRVPLAGRADERVSIPVLERRIVIKVDVRYATSHFVRSHWQWLVATVSGLAGAILAWAKLVQG